MEKGTVIFLNGTSSSGKSAIAGHIQSIFREPFLHVSVDKFIYMLPGNYLTGGNNEGLKESIPRIVSGMHRAIPALSDCGNNLVVDHVLEREEWLDECAGLPALYPAYLIAVRCPLEILKKREKERGDRQEGLAEYQYDRVHSRGMYDFEMDTSEMSAEECARAIKTYVENHEPFAFEKLDGEEKGR